MHCWPPLLLCCFARLSFVLSADTKVHFRLPLTLIPLLSFSLPRVEMAAPPVHKDQVAGSNATYTTVYSTRF